MDGSCFSIRYSKIITTNFWLKLRNWLRLSQRLIKITLRHNC